MIHLIAHICWWPAFDCNVMLFYLFMQVLCAWQWIAQIQGAHRCVSWA